MRLKDAIKPISNRELAATRGGNYSGDPCRLYSTANCVGNVCADEVSPCSVLNGICQCGTNDGGQGGSGRTNHNYRAR
jgi:hypothetical protein